MATPPFVVPPHRANIVWLIAGILVVFGAASLTWFALTSFLPVQKSSEKIPGTLTVTTAEIKAVPGVIIAKNGNTFTIRPYNAPLFSSDKNLLTRSVRYASDTPITIRTETKSAEEYAAEEQAYSEEAQKAQSGDAKALAYLKSHTAPQQYVYTATSTEHIKVGDQIVVFTALDVRTLPTFAATGIQIESMPQEPKLAVPQEASSTKPNSLPPVHSTKLHWYDHLVSLVYAITPSAFAGSPTTHQGVLHWSGNWTANQYWCDAGYSLQGYHYDEASANNTTWYACVGPDTNNPPKGNMDAGTCTYTAGWAYDPDTTNQSIYVNIYIDGTFVGQVLANQTRTDVQNGFGLPMAQYGFWAGVPGQYSDGQNHTVSAVAIDTWGGPNTTVGSATFNCGADLTATAGQNYTISLGSGVTVAGSAYNGGSAATLGGFWNNVLISNQGVSNWASSQQVWVNTLGSGASAGLTAYFGPSSFPTVGTYGYTVCANYNTSWQTTVPETNYGNNCAPSYGYITVTAPDITAAVGNAVAGITNQALGFWGTISNVGNGTGSNFPSVVHFCDSGCTNVNFLVSAGSTSLGAGASQSVGANYTFTNPGTYYYQICGNLNTSWTNIIQESNYGNNCSNWQTITISAPTGGISASPNPCTISSGSTCATTVSWNANVSAVQVYVRQNGGGETLMSQTGGSGSAVPNWIQGPPNYYDFNLYDYSNGVKGNLLGSVRVTANEADLVGFPGPVSSATIGAPITLYAAIENWGTATAYNVPNIIQICDTASCGGYNQYVSATTIGAIAADSSGNTYTNISAAMTAPSYPGNFVYRTCANITSSWTNSVPESNYGNNCSSWQTLTVTAPNLVASPGPWLSIYNGQTANLSATITNSGNASTGAAFHNEWQVTLSDQSTVVENGNTDVGTLGPGASAGTSRTTSYTFPNPGTYYYRVCADNNFAVGGGWQGSITESNENDNCSAWQGITVNQVQPDLSVIQGSAASAVISTSQSLSATVQNTGNGAAAGFPNILQVCDAANGCGQYNNVTAASYTSSLGIGGQAVVSGTQTMPWSPGNYMYRFCANLNTSWQNSITESNYGNNCSGWSTLTITAPDITAASGAVVNGYTNRAVTLAGTVSNIGNATASWFANSVHICDGNCATVNTMTAASAVGSLAPNASSGVSGTYTFTNPGTYYYQICGNYNTSWQTTIAESNYGNNCGSWQSITITAPSGGISASPNPCTITSGTSCTSTISWNSNVSATQVYVRQNGGGETLFSSTGGSGSAPASWIGQPGNYYDFNEYDYSTGSKGNLLGTVRVTALEANITANTPSTANATLNQPVTLASYVVNNGNGSAGTFSNIVQICDNNCATINSTIAASSVASLSAGSSQYVSGTYTPNSMTQLYYRICGNLNTSWTNIVPETSYGDNCSSWAALNVAPPLPSGPTNGQTYCSPDGHTVSVTWTKSTYATSYYPRFYSSYYNSHPTDCTNAGWQLWTDNSTCYPNPDTWSQTGVTNFPIQPGVAYGWYVVEGNSAGVNWNNSTGNGYFICAGYPDLTANQPANAAATTNHQIALSGTIINNGTGATSGGFWNLLQVCSDTSCSTYNNVTQVWGAALSAGGSQVVSNTITAPSNGGNYVYRFCANFNTGWVNTVTESNYGNNCSGWATFTVTPPPPPTGTFTASSYTISGQPVTLTWSSSNATSCTGNGFSTGGATSGSTQVNPTSSATYDISCSGEGGTWTAQPVTVGCNGSPTPSISANHKLITNGQSVTFTMNGVGVNNSCVLTGPPGTTLATYPASFCSIGNNVTYTVNNVQNQTKYCLSCDGGTPSCVTVSVTPKFLGF